MKIYLFLSLIISSTFLFSNSLLVFAKNEIKLNKKNQLEIQKVLKNIQDKDPQKLISQKLTRNEKDQNELNSNQSDNLQIKFNLKDKKVKLKNKNKGDISVGIPNSDSFDSVDLVENKLIY